MKATITQGLKRGRFRWQARDEDGKLVALSPVVGFARYLEAVNAVRAIFPDCEVERRGRFQGEE